jgi:hypothetical protein
MDPILASVIVTALIALVALVVAIVAIIYGQKDIAALALKVLGQVSDKAPKALPDDIPSKGEEGLEDKTGQQKSITA